MTYTKVNRLATIAHRNQHPVKDLLYTGAIVTGIFALAAVLLSVVF